MYLSSLSSSPNVSRYIEPQIQALSPLMTTMVAEFTRRKGAVPAPQAMLCFTASCIMFSFPGQTIIPHSRQMVGSLGTCPHSHTLHFCLW